MESNQGALRTLRLGVVVAAVAILAASLALRGAFPIIAAANAGHDDALFVRLAASIAAGDWLGPYDNLTHAKGAAYSAFIALAHLAGVPLKLAEHAAYLASCALFSWVVASLLRSRAAGLACLAFLAFNPVVWSFESGGRVVRENLYAPLSLAVLALAAHVFVPRRRASLASLAALGLVGALFWLTREEGLWLAPSLAILVTVWAAREWRETRRAAEPPAWAPTFRVLAIPVAAFALVVGAVNLANYVRYGEFRNNDFRSRDYQQAYGALARITHENPRPYVVFPADARRKAYAASAAARELAPFFEGPGGENWRAVGCGQTRTEACPEILSGWFMWALRDAAAHAGHYASATKARAFYRTLAREVNAACDQGKLACGPRADTLVPPWRGEQGRRIVDETLAVVRALATLGDMNVAMVPSSGSERERALFARMTGDRQTRDEDWLKVEPGLMAVAQAIARIQVAAMPWLLAAAFLGSIVLGFLALLRRRWHDGFALLAALWVAVATRVGLLGFLAATAIPPNHVLYLTPVVPMALVLAPFVLFLALDLRRRAS